MFNSRKSYTRGFTECSSYGNMVEQWMENWASPKIQILHNPVFPINEYECNPIGIVHKRFYKMLSSMPYWGGLLIRLKDFTSVVSGGVNGALYKPNAVLMQT